MLTEAAKILKKIGDNQSLEECYNLMKNFGISVKGWKLKSLRKNSLYKYTFTVLFNFAGIWNAWSCPKLVCLWNLTIENKLFNDCKA